MFEVLYLALAATALVNSLDRTTKAGRAVYYATMTVYGATKTFKIMNEK